jgi:hypothetical protein
VFYSQKVDTQPSPSKEPKSLSEAEALKLSESAWPRAYLLASEEKRKALELLLLCEIIPSDEFANGDVSHAHVEECMWIAMQMLRQKNFSVWIDNPLAAQRTFDTSVTTRFPARQMVRSALSNSGAVTPASERGMVDCRSTAQSPAGSPQPPQFYKRDPGRENIKKVQVRCEELATGSALDLTPRCMIRALQEWHPPASGKSSFVGRSVSFSAESPRIQFRTLQESPPPASGKSSAVGRVVCSPESTSISPLQDRSTT